MGPLRMVGSEGSRETESAEEVSGYMFRPGQRVTRMTKKVGQAAPTGKVVKVHHSNVEVQWEDGHVSFVTPEGLMPANAGKK